MSIILQRQQLSRRIDAVLKGHYFSTKHGDTVITLYTDNDCAHVIKNRFSTRLKKIFAEPVYDFTIHLYNSDTDLHFNRDGDLIEVLRFPDHSTYAERCDCQAYTSTPVGEYLVKCYSAECNHGIYCARKRSAIADLVVRKVEAEILRIKDEGSPTNYANTQKSS